MLKKKNVHFNVHYVFTDEGSCSPNVTGYQYITLTGSSGTIQSPNYPSSYPNSMDCVWKITAPYGKEVNLTFTHMSLQYMYSCTADFVELRDGLTSYSSRIGSYCGSSLPSPKYSNGRHMLVRFHSDGNVTSAGFAANFEAFDSTRYTDNCKWNIFNYLWRFDKINFLTRDVEQVNITGNL